MKILALDIRRTFDAAGGGAGGAGGDAGGGDTAGADAAKAVIDAAKAGASDAKPAGETKGQDGAAIYRPEGVADNLVGKSDRETMDNLAKALTGYRTRDSERGAVPKDAAGYTFELTDKLKSAIPRGLAEDPVFKAAADSAHKAGLSTKEFQAVIIPALEKMAELTAGEAWSPDAEFKKLAGENAGPDQIKAVQQRFVEASGWIEGFVAHHTLADGARLELQQLLSSADGLLVLEAIRKSGSDGIRLPNAGLGQGTRLSAADLQKRQSDPRNDATGPKYDPAFRAETDRLYREFHGQG